MIECETEAEAILPDQPENQALRDYNRAETPHDKLAGVATILVEELLERNPDDRLSREETHALFANTFKRFMKLELAKISVGELHRLVGTGIRERELELINEMAGSRRECYEWLRSRGAKAASGE